MTREWKIFFLRDGLPIGLGYFAVSFALGIQASGAGLTAWQAALMSVLNVTSAGEAAAIGLLGVGTTYVELAFTQLVINIRYLLMSCSLSQKIAPKTSVLHRLLIGYGVTDEIFGISMGVEGKLSPAYSYGAIAVAVPCWTLGTLLGAVLGNILPARAVSALGVALYAMFLAIILPPARRSRTVLLTIVIAAVTHTLFYYLPYLNKIPSGLSISICAVFSAALCAILFPIKDEKEDSAQ